MTIKQNGGVFGRHPTFSSADVDGNLTVSGNTSAKKTLLVGATNDPLLTLRANNDSGNPGLSNTLRFEDVDTATQPGQQTGRIEFYMADTYGAGAGVNSYINVDSDQFGRPTFTVGTGETGAVSNRLSINYLGDVTVNTGNLVIGTSGQGIDFSATPGTGTSELFDDYEEGTFTPTLITDGTQFTSVTYDTLVTAGRYTKIGNVVHVQGSLRTDAVTVGSASGSVCVGNLPFTVTANTVGTQNGISAISIGAASAWAGEQPISATTVANTTRFELLYRTAVDGATANTAVADVGTGADDNIIRFSATYIAA